MSSHIFSMGGYGVYVWTSYFITLVVLGGNLFSSFLERQRAKKIVKQFYEPMMEGEALEP